MPRVRMFVERSAIAETDEGSQKSAAHGGVGVVQMTMLPEPCVTCGCELGELWQVEHHPTVDVLHFLCRTCFTPALDVRSTVAPVVPQRWQRTELFDINAAH